MRYVDYGALVLPSGWAKKAADALVAVRKAGAAGRSAELAMHQDVWRELKPALAKLTGEKCFYCETVRVRDDYEVDHYRPKLSVPADGHRGYWWLAFKPGNLYFSCRFCNQRRRGMDGEPGGGKGSAFPLGAGGVRAEKETDVLDDEFPLLLDPSDKLDPPLLAFDDLGRAMPSACPSGEPVDFARARASVRLFHLNHGLVRRRREQKAVLLRSKITDASLHIALAKRWRERGKPEAEQTALKAAKLILDELVQLQYETEEYSALAVSIMRIQATQRPWLQRYVKGV